MITIALLAANLLIGPRIQTPETVEGVVEAMIERYVGMWYRDITFVQTTSYLDVEERVTRSEQWYESISLPGKLRIDVAPVGEGRVLIFNDEVFYQFEGGVLRGSSPQVHPLLLMGFDAYFMTVEDVLTRLEGLGVHLDRMHESMWQGRPVYVLGAERGDETSHQFWIDQERLVFVRQLRGEQETQFNNYERLGGGWVAPEVVFLTAGKRTLVEEYRDIRMDHDLEDNAFSAEGSRIPSWIPRR